jgi:membrane protease YdiL (CAAX protease family)
MLSKKKQKLIVTFLTLTLILFSQWIVFRKIEISDGIWGWFFSAIFLFFLLPVVVIKYVFNENIKDYNFSFKLKKEQVWRILLELVLFFGIILFFVLKFNLKGHLLTSFWVLEKIDLVLFVDFLLLPIIIISQEFFFRGFLLEIFRKNFGIFLGVLFQAIVFLFYIAMFRENIQWQTLLLYGVFNMFLGWLVIRSRSIFVSATVSWIVSVSISIFVLYQISLIKG